MGSRSSNDFKADVIEEAVDNATAFVKGKLGKEIAAKVDAAQSGATDEAKSESTDSVVRMIASFIAAHFAYTAQFGAKADSDSDFSTNYEKATVWLDEIRDGKMDIPGIEINLLPKSTTQDYQPAFQVDDPVQHDIDSDRLDDITDDRE